MGKKVVLSDIPVHREQNPERGIFFTPDKPGELSENLAASLNDYDPEEEKMLVGQARAGFSDRIKDFAKNYEKIVLDIYDRHGDNRY